MWIIGRFALNMAIYYFAQIEFSTWVFYIPVQHQYILSCWCDILYMSVSYRLEKKSVPAFDPAFPCACFQFMNLSLSVGQFNNSCNHNQRWWVHVPGDPEQKNKHRGWIRQAFFLFLLFLMKCFINVEYIWILNTTSTSIEWMENEIWRAMHWVISFMFEFGLRIPINHEKLSVTLSYSLETKI